MSRNVPQRRVFNWTINFYSSCRRSYYSIVISLRISITLSFIVVATLDHISCWSSISTCKVNTYVVLELKRNTTLSNFSSLSKFVNNEWMRVKEKKYGKEEIGKKIYPLSKHKQTQLKSTLKYHRDPSQKKTDSSHIISHAISQSLLSDKLSRAHITFYDTNMTR